MPLPSQFAASGSSVITTATEKGVETPATAASTSTTSPHAGASGSETPPLPPTPAHASMQGPVQFVSPPPRMDEGLDADDDAEVEHRYRRVPDLYSQDAGNPGGAELLLLTPTGEPATLAEAEGDEAWRLAMIDELTSIKENDTWSLSELP